MAEVTNQTSVPGKNKGGFFAILMCDTGEVWLSETRNFKQVLSTYATSNNAECVKAAVKRGARLELYFLTKPEIFSAQILEDELYTADLLAFRKTRNLTGPGNLYVIRHDSTMDYFVIADRQGLPTHTLLSNFYGRLLNQSTCTRNTVMNEFITAQANDIIKQVGFTITHLDKFDNREDEWLKRQVYIDEAKYGRSLNWQSVE
jgi:hypothetical protein